MILIQPVFKQCAEHRWRQSLSRIMIMVMINLCLTVKTKKNSSCKVMCNYTIDVNGNTDKEFYDSAVRTLSWSGSWFMRMHSYKLFRLEIFHFWVALSVAFLSPLHTCGCWRSAPHRRLPSARFHPVGGVLPVLDRFRPFPLCCGPLRVARLIHTRGSRWQPPHQQLLLTRASRRRQHRHSRDTEARGRDMEGVGGSGLEGRGVDKRWRMCTELRSKLTQVPGRATWRVWDASVTALSEALDTCRQEMAAAVE